MAESEQRRSSRLQPASASSTTLYEGGSMVSRLHPASASSTTLGAWSQVNDTTDDANKSSRPSVANSIRESTQSTVSTRSFRDSTPLIPSPEGKRPPRFMPIILRDWTIAAIIVFTLALAVALEIGLFISKYQGGFAVSQRNVFPVSPQFLLSFFPTLLVIPVAFLWRELDWNLRWYHPYVILSRGRAEGQETLLLDYIAAGLSYTFLYAFKYKHWVVYWSAQTAMLSYIFQPLAGAIFTLQQKPTATDINTNGLTVIGLQDLATRQNLDAYLASAGFADAAAYNNLTDPPFISGGWSAAQFELPQYYTVNGSIQVETSGIQHSVNCGGPSIPPTLNSTTLLAQSTDNCIGNVSLVANQGLQYGVVDVPCGDTDPNNVPFHEVMFWWLNTDSSNKQRAQTIFCKPSIQLLNVEITMNLTDRSITDVKKLNDYSLQNDVSGAPLGGKAYNGLTFNTSTLSPIIQARAAAIQASIPSTVYRLVQQDPRGVDVAFSDTKGVQSLLEPIYTQHLAVAGKSVYFTKPTDSQLLKAKLVSTLNRLIIDPLAGHALAFVLILIAIIGTIVQFRHRRARRDLYLTSPPGTIAATLALASRSGFGELLLPYDDRKTLVKKLSPLRFKLDKRTGAIAIDGDAMGVEYKMPGSAAVSATEGRNEAMMALLGDDKLEEVYRRQKNHTPPLGGGHDSSPPTSYPPYRTPFDAVS